MTVDLLYACLLPHQGPLLYVQHAVFYAGHAVAHHAVVVEHAAVPVLRIVRHGRIGPLPAAGNAAAKAQLGQSFIKQGGIVRGDEEVFLVHGFGLERPGAVPLKPELLLHHKSVLHQLVRDNAADLFAGLALFSMGGVNQIPADAAVLAVGSCAVECARQLLLAPRRLLHVLAPFSGFAKHANAGALRTGFSLAARRSRKSTGFCRGVWRCAHSRRILCNLGKREQFARIMSKFERYKTCTFLHNKKAALTSGFSSIDNKKGDRPRERSPLLILVLFVLGAGLDLLEHLGHKLVNAHLNGLVRAIAD